eukprot:scaffold8161_cov111-Cylindrotheca_fusiformis.AAC.2
MVVPSSKTVWLCLLVWFSCCCCRTIHANKQLVFFAGPHQAGASSVEKFYHNALSAYNNARTSEALDGWIWPKIQGNMGLDYEIERHKVFNYLVTHTDEQKDHDLQWNLMEAIKTAYQKATQGVLIGSEEFDRIGETRQTKRDGLMAMQTVVNTLHVEQEDVWVIFNYRTPRIDQWAGFWKHNDETDNYESRADGFDDDDDADNEKLVLSYMEFLCNPGQQDRIWEAMNSAMNPLGMTQYIREQTGWNVVLIDLAGVQTVGADVSHVIACEVLGNTDCQNGFVSDRYNKTFHLNHVEMDLCGELDDDQMEALEVLFRQRDCAYQEELTKDPGVYTLLQSTLWQGCSSDHDDVYQQLKDTTTILDLAQSEIGCQTSNKNIDEFLVGNYTELTFQKDKETLKKENPTYIIDENSKPTNAGKSTGGKRGDESKNRNFSLGWLFGFALVAAVGYRMYANRYNDDPSSRLWNTSREHKTQAYRPSDYDLDAEYGMPGFRDQVHYVDSDNDDDEASQEELEMSPTKSPFPDWRDDNNMEDDMNRINSHKMMMQMPKRKKSALMAPAPGKKNYEDGFDLSWAHGNEIESSEEEDSGSEFEDER